MSYLVRKISIGNWNVDNPNFEDVSADAITKDLKTEGNINSWWKIDNLDDLEMMALSIASCFELKGNVGVVAIPFETIDEKLDIQQSAGKTAIIEYQSAHYDITNLNYRTLGILASLILKQLNNTRNYHLLTFKKIIEKIKKIIQDGNLTINRDLLGNAIKESV